MEGFGAIIAFVIGWFFAQIGKFLVIASRRGNKLKFRDILSAVNRSGGMPSGHTASFVALDTYFGMTYGFDNPLFALALCTTIIFIYDAVNVRYAVGEQGKILNSMIMADERKKKSLKVVEGHTLPQVIVGAAIGIVVGLCCSVIF